MRHYLILLSLLLIPVSLPAADGMSCHCFQDRSYDPQRPGAAEAYVLATTQNSLLAELFDYSKRQIVAAKMGGTPGADLWLAGYIGARTGRSSGELLERLEKAGSWERVLRALDGFPEWLDPAVAQPILGSKPLDVVVGRLVDLHVIRHLGLDADAIGELRNAGASDQEVILSALLAQRTARPAPALFAEQRDKALPWDMLLHQAGIEADQIDTLLREMVNKGQA